MHVENSYTCTSRVENRLVIQSDLVGKVINLLNILQNSRHAKMISSNV